MDVPIQHQCIVWFSIRWSSFPIVNFATTFWPLGDPTHLMLWGVGAHLSVTWEKMPRVPQTVWFLAVVGILIIIFDSMLMVRKLDDGDFTNKLNCKLSTATRNKMVWGTLTLSTYHDDIDDDGIDCTYTYARLRRGSLSLTKLSPFHLDVDASMHWWEEQ